MKGCWICNPQIPFNEENLDLICTGCGSNQKIFFHCAGCGRKEDITENTAEFIKMLGAEVWEKVAKVGLSKGEVLVVISCPECPDGPKEAVFMISKMPHLA